MSPSPPKKKKIAVLTWGRMNPFHIGHKNLIQQTINKANAMGGNAFVGLTHTQNAKKNPLNQNQKLYYLRKKFPNERRPGVIKTIPKQMYNPNHVAQYLRNTMGYNNVHFFVGNNYSGNKNSYKFLEKSARISPGAQRSATGMEAKFVRAAALRGNLPFICSAMNLSPQNATYCMKLIQQGMTPAPTKRKKANSPPKSARTPAPKKRKSPSRVSSLRRN
jgi:nicotinamide mononucleotide adenylyltransferase